MTLSKWDELRKTGSVRLYEKEGFEVYEIVQLVEQIIDRDTYAYGIEENRHGDIFLELIKYN